jgi:protoheme IX farnesyltransferase
LWPWLLDLVALSKPRITLMVLVATGVGYALGAGGPLDWIHLGGVLAGTLLVSAGVMGINQYMERDMDRLMERTSDRPLPAGRMRPGAVLALSATVSTAGMVVLALWANPISAVIGLLVVVTYLACYTPLKRRSGLNTLVGAVPGALPPVLGWAAAHGSVGQEAAALFLIMFIWQPPHFLSIAYLYRKDYANAGLPMLPVLDPGGNVTRRQLVIYSATLIPASMYPSMIGITGEIYFFGALGLSLLFFAAALAMALRQSDATAKLLLKVSIAYLPLLFALMLYDSSGAAHVHSHAHVSVPAPAVEQFSTIAAL